MKMKGSKFDFSIDIITKRPTKTEILHYCHENELLCLPIAVKNSLFSLNCKKLFLPLTKRAWH